MCEKCYGYIYDTLLSPLPANHLLNGYIHLPSLKRCADEVTHCLQRALNYFDNDEFFFINVEDDYLNEFLATTKNGQFKNYLIDEFTWNKYNKYYNGTEDLEYAIQLCLEHSITRKVILREQVIRHFFMHKLGCLLMTLPDIHNEHITKKQIRHVPSPGPVPLDKIINIRSKLGLPVSNWERETAHTILFGEDPLYL